MAASIDITKGLTLGDTATKADFHNLVDNATATISGIEMSEIDWAGADADVSIGRASTTTSIFKITGDSLTTGSCLELASTSTGTHLSLTGTASNGTPAEGDVWYDGTTLKLYDGTSTLALGPTKGTITFVIDGGGAAITTGSKGFLEIPFACTITRWTMVADQSCTATMDINRDTYADFDTAGTSIVGGSSVPTITAAVKGQDTDVTDWTSDDIVAGDLLEFDVDSNDNATQITLSLYYTRTE